MTDSYYHAHAAKVPAAPPLDGTVEAETGIIGGGLAGLATALSLAERGRTAVLLEARTVGAGASGRNGGMVSAGFAASHALLERAVGPVAARTLIGLSREAMALMRARDRAPRDPLRPGRRACVDRLLVRRCGRPAGRGRRA